jgi:hypothetical protein
MTTANASERPATTRGGLLARHPLISFFVMAYAGTWLVTVPVALSANGVGLLPFCIPEGSVFFVSAAWVFLGPTLAAFIMTGTTEGRASIRRLLHVAGRPPVVPGSSYRFPCDHIARHDRAAGGSGIVSDARSSRPAALAR